jgi:pimeloyl-ACP methyl ester carboxylesterase
MVLRFLWAACLSLLCVSSAWADGEMHPMPGWERHLVGQAPVQMDVFEKGHGTAVIMYPSLGRGAQDFEQLGNAVAAAGYRAILVNPRGLGASTGPMDGITLHDLGADMWMVADQLHIKRAVILGQIYGNRVARTAASDQNDRVMGLILIGAGGEVEMAHDTLEEFMKVFDPSLPAERRQQAVAKVFFAPGSDATAWKDGWFPNVARKEIAATQNTDMKKIYLGGTAPGLVVQGLDDKIALPVNAWNLVTRRPNTRLVALPNAGHAMLPEQPAAVADAVIDFLKTVH